MAFKKIIIFIFVFSSLIGTTSSQAMFNAGSRWFNTNKHAIICFMTAHSCSSVLNCRRTFNGVILAWSAINFANACSLANDNNDSSRTYVRSATQGLCGIVLGEAIRQLFIWHKGPRYVLVRDVLE